MNWHRIEDELPPITTPAYQALCYDGSDDPEFDEDLMFVAHFMGAGFPVGTTCWLQFWDRQTLHRTVTHWSEISLPE